MDFDPIDASKVEGIGGKLDDVIVVLTDGDRIHGSGPQPTWDEDEEDEMESPPAGEPESLAVTVGSRRVYVPTSEVHAVFPAGFTQRRDRTVADTADSRTPPVVESVRRETDETVETHGFDVEHRLGLPSFDGSSGAIDFDWGETEYSDYTQIYADLDYFDRKGTVTDVGLTLMGFGITVGGERDVDKLARRKVKDRNLTSIRSVDGTFETVTVSGRPNHLGTDDLSQTMEGRTWDPYVVSDSPASDADDLAATDWVLCWFAREWFHVPRDYALETDQTIRVFGEVIDSSVRTGFGDVERSIKVRSAAYCGD